MSKWLHKRKLISHLYESKEQNQKDWTALSRHHERLAGKHKDVASRQNQMDYSFSTQHPLAWKDKRELVNHWVKRVYSPADGDKENENFWKNEVKTIHWLGFFSEDPVAEILERYLSGDAFPQAELSTVGYLPGPSVSPYGVGLELDGSPVYASSGDLYTEFLSTLTDGVVERFFDEYERIVKTPNLKVNPRDVLTSKFDAEFRAKRNNTNRISEVIVADWTISKVYISAQLEDEIKNTLIKKCNNYNVQYELFRNTFTA